MTISIAEPDLSFGSWEQDSAMGDHLSMLNGTRSSLQSFAELQHRASSTCLGFEAPAFSGATEPSDTSTTRPIPRPCSSATIKSFYDPKRSPLAISQQTSATSIRDFALRKGCAEISEPLMEEEFVFPEPPRLAEHPEIAKRLSELERDGPQALQLDFTKLFPTPLRTPGPLLSPTRLTHSPSTLSLISEHTTAPPPPPEMLSSASNVVIGQAPSKIDSSHELVPERKASLASRSNTPSQTFSSATMTPPTVTRRITQPEDRPMSWVDMDDETDHNSAETGTVSVVAATSPRLRSKPPSQRSNDSRRQSTHSISSAQLSAASSGRVSTISRQPSATSEPKALAQAWADRTNAQDPAATIRPPSKRVLRQSAQRLFLGSDLQIQSILELSSSDEDESSDETSTAQTSLSTPDDDDYEAKTSFRRNPRGGSKSNSRSSSTAQPARAPLLRTIDLPHISMPTYHRSQSEPVSHYPARTSSRKVEASSPMRDRPDHNAPVRRPPPGRSEESINSRSSWLDLQPPAGPVKEIKSIMRTHHSHDRIRNHPAVSHPRPGLPERRLFYSDKIHSVLGPDAPRSTDQHQRTASSSGKDAKQTSRPVLHRSQDSLSKPRVSFDIDLAPMERGSGPPTSQVAPTSPATSPLRSALIASNSSKAAERLGAIPRSAFSNDAHKVPSQPLAYGCGYGQSRPYRSGYGRMRPTTTSASGAYLPMYGGTTLDNARRIATSAAAWNARRGTQLWDAAAVGTAM